MMTVSGAAMIWFTFSILINGTEFELAYKTERECIYAVGETLMFFGHRARIIESDTICDPRDVGKPRNG